MIKIILLITATFSFIFMNTANATSVECNGRISSSSPYPGASTSALMLLSIDETLGRLNFKIRREVSRTEVLTELRTFGQNSAKGEFTFSGNNSSGESLRGSIQYLSDTGVKATVRFSGDMEFDVEYHCSIFRVN